MCTYAARQYYVCTCVGAGCLTLSSIIFLCSWDTVSSCAHMYLQADLMEKKGLWMDAQEAQDKLKETKEKLKVGRERLEQIKADIARDQAPLL